MLYSLPHQKSWNSDGDISPLKRLTHKVETKIPLVLVSAIGNAPESEEVTTSLGGRQLSFFFLSFFSLPLQPNPSTHVGRHPYMQIGSQMHTYAHTWWGRMLFFHTNEIVCVCCAVVSPDAYISVYREMEYPHMYTPSAIEHSNNPNREKRSENCSCSAMLDARPSHATTINLPLFLYIPLMYYNVHIQ